MDACIWEQIRSGTKPDVESILTAHEVQAFLSTLSSMVAHKRHTDVTPSIDHEVESLVRELIVTNITMYKGVPSDESSDEGSADSRPARGLVANTERRRKVLAQLQLLLEGNPSIN